MALLHCSLPRRLRVAAWGARWGARHGDHGQPEHKSQLGCKCPARGVLWLRLFVGWGQAPFLAEGSKSSCVLSAGLAEQPNQVWSFGVGGELPFLRGALARAGSASLCPRSSSSSSCEQAGGCCAWGARSRGAAVMDGDFCGGAPCDGGRVRLGARGSALPRGVPRGGRCVGGPHGEQAAELLCWEPQYTCVGRQAGSGEEGAAVLLS